MTDLVRGPEVTTASVQPRLFHSLNSVSVNANPDLVGFASGDSVRIVDWKVHSFGLRAAKQQLLVYAGVLHRGSRYPSYPVDPRGISLDRFTLTEVQLLNNVVHDYAATDEEIDEVFDEFFEVAELMRLAQGMTAIPIVVPRICCDAVDRNLRSMQLQKDMPGNLT